MARRRYEQTGRWFAQKHGLDKVFHRLDRVFVLEANFQNQYRKAVQEAAEIAVERLQYCMLSDDRSQYCIRRQWYRPGRKTTIDTDGWMVISWFFLQFQSHVVDIWEHGITSLREISLD